MNNPIIPNLSNIIVKFGQLTPAILSIIQALAGMLAIILTIRALFAFYKMTQEIQSSQTKGIMGPLTELVVAGILFSLSQGLVVQNIVANFTTQVQFKMPAQFSLLPNEQNMQSLRVALGLAIENIMFLVGTVGIMRGLLILKRMSYGEQNYKMSSVLSYLISGSLALNINTIVSIFDNGLGTRFGEILFGR
jgi:hypothetical protein